MKQRHGIRSPRPRRVVIRAGIFLLLGAIVNIAVAWGCAVLVDAQSGSALMRDGFSRREQPTVLWSVRAWETAGACCIWSSWRGLLLDIGSIRVPKTAAHALVPPWASVAWPSGPMKDTGSCNVIVDGRGWPVVSMWSAIRFDTDVADRLISKSRTAPFTQVIAGFENPYRPLTNSSLIGPYGPEHLNLLPLRPIWPGFAINTLLYGATLWLLFAAPFALRRWRRIKRGLCPACAYPVGASDLCTECGMPVSARKVEPASS